MPLIEYFRDQSTYQLTGVLTIVDSLMIAQDFAMGQEIIPRLQENLQHGTRDVVNLLVEQIMFCSHLLLSKADKLPDGGLEHIAQHAHQLNPYVAVTSVPWGRLDFKEILALPMYDFHRVAQLIDDIKPGFIAQQNGDVGVDQQLYNMTSEVIIDDRPFHPQRLFDTCQQFLGDKIYRSKGFFWLASRDKESLLWNQAAGSISLELVGSWRIGVLDDPHNILDDYEKNKLQEIIAEKGGRFGDRHCHLTVIGDQNQVATFTAALKKCFLTEEEIATGKPAATSTTPGLKATDSLVNNPGSILD